jgi:predicted metallopeptidase
MKKKLLLIIGAILLIIVVIFFIFKSPKQDTFFNRIELNDNNYISLNVKQSYYDTIISVGLDEMNLRDIRVVILELSDNHKSQFNGDLRAHIRYHEDVYYLFIGDYGRENSIDILSHEIIHISQYYSGKLNYENDVIKWNDRVYQLNDIEYEDRPWEIEAFSQEKELSNKIKNRLYN